MIPQIVLDIFILISPMFSLRFAVELCGLLAQTAPPAWQDIADKIKIPFVPELKYHPEFDGYTQGEMP